MSMALPILKPLTADQRMREASLEMPVAGLATPIQIRQLESCDKVAEAEIDQYWRNVNIDDTAARCRKF